MKSVCPSNPGPNGNVWPRHRVANLALAGVVAAVAIALPCRARAQVAETGTKTTSSVKLRDGLAPQERDLFDRASTDYRNKKWVEAEAGFTKVYESSKETRVLYNVAVSQKAQGHFAAAIATLRKAVTTTRNLQDTAFLTTVSDSIAALKQEVAILKLDPYQIEMAVSIDKSQAVIGDQNGEFFVDPGAREVQVANVGFETQREERTFSRGETTKLETKRKRLEATVRIAVTDNLGATLLIDGSQTATLPWSGTLSVGQHTLRVDRQGFRPETRVVNIAETGSDLKLALTPIEAQTLLRIACERADCAIQLDNKRIGTGAFAGYVASGERRVTVSAPDSEPKLIELSLRENEPRELRVSLNRKSSGISPWVWIISGAVVAGGATTALVIATRPTNYEGTTPGTLQPVFIGAGRSPFAR
jgi:hypothetical protein